ncbi:unnamed protein product [Psylliodes chrysocephalus]|uniref:Uncharacterized protein n=1 Tax=Psylliodes chrysocephalus TaxID=3402493 RepID=A0A9P0GEI2_9CUCU|nr:unnamed protein product [Psylliodes chrysocephala]
MQRDIFDRMLGISLSHKVDIEKVLSFPLTSLPTSKCYADGTICKTDKAQFVAIIEKTMEDNINKHPLCFDIAILDGFFMKEIPQTFNGLSNKVLSTITQFKASRIDNIFDQYFTPSIKDSKRTRRDESASPVSIGSNQIRPHNYTAQLKNIQFKEDLVKFFLKTGLLTTWHLLLAIKQFT